MKALTYIEHGKFALTEKPKPDLLDERDAIVMVTLGSICSSDLHIKHGSVPRAVPGITVGHEMVGIVSEVGPKVTTVKPGDRVTVNVETFCGQCFFCQNGWVNNCETGGWKLGCRIDGGQAEFVRVPYADQGLNKIPDSVTDEQALFVGDVLATGYWAAKISEIKEEDTVLIIGAGPTGLCTLLCVMLKNPKHIIVCEADPARRRFVLEHWPQVTVIAPECCPGTPRLLGDHGGADVVIEVAGTADSFQMAWRSARPNATIVYKANKGFCDLQFSNCTPQELYPRVKEYISGRMTIEKAGKSASVRIAVSPVWFESKFEDKLDEVHNALEAISELYKLSLMLTEQ